MTGSGNDDSHCTHVGEWAELIGDEVPDRAKDERLLRWPGVEDDENDCEVNRNRNGGREWPQGAS
jgi:hypothetical protein